MTSSLLSNATDFNEWSTSNSTPIQKKRQIKTQKRSASMLDDEKVQKVLRHIQEDADEEEDDMGNFTPPPNPINGMGTNKATTSDIVPATAPGSRNISPFTTERDNAHTLKEAHMTPAQAQAYYRSMNVNTNNNNNNNITADPGEYDKITNKLNYIINLLEEQQDERTNNVTEDVVLYSFLGIFIIFIADSFARVGKYTR